ncbi:MULTISPECIES: hypothetical protein [Pseudoxanthomonas]|jgi:hypothetical protein|uniref:Ribbon-helix-helix protein, CopG family n=1 Tax=Pseudoxanthomonas winnipegensis TaxID=2480810 RepID=A0A4Q8L7N8_9GAMM|nr:MULTISPECIES: hypothetical protein [Pseudoxanthomonas]MDQ1121424.1 hypothetical protein [Pseudoxanthomonas winnipegensis]MDQ1134658.1 hypothetical protein [Pseudoxanthomonas winnipegensis]MDR6139110.1 hypothetical protein [Pseudoxanthomonas sp. SORGH_AS_0997]RZZ81280.1 hypothetical protein EA662_18205 [Pseudoxanthomonas winnipegensis]RZZ81383.1 hypothetical protein EA663_20370 [Pseudoxanthomonas winnipegensis]
MTDLLIRDLDPILTDRIRRVAQARGWSTEETISRLIEHGLFAVEAEVRNGFSDPEVAVLSEAIAALRAVPHGGPAS